MSASSFIPYGHQWIDEDDIAAVAEVLRSDYLTTGPKVREFEEAFAAYVGAKYAVAVSSGTAALHAAAFAAGFGPGDEVITTPITFVATANCILYRGATPVFADIDPRTYNIDPEQVARRITPRTKAIIPVHFTGQPCDLGAIYDIARQHGLTVIEDAAHALGAEYKGRRIGGLSDLTIFSFHPVKHITTGEGGMVTTNSWELYERLLMFRNHGMTREPEKWIGWEENTVSLYPHGNVTSCGTDSPGSGSRAGRAEAPECPWYYEVQLLGYNYRLSDIHAALGLSQLKKADKFLVRRREIAGIYNQAFAGLPGLTTPYQAPWAASSWHIYVLQVDAGQAGISRNELLIRLRDQGIGANLHYIPVYRHPLYRSLALNPSDYPAAETFYRRAITLPLFPAMTPAEVDRVIEATRLAVLEGNENSPTKVGCHGRPPWPGEETLYNGGVTSGYR